MTNLYIEMRKGRSSSMSMPEPTRVMRDLILLQSRNMIVTGKMGTHTREQLDADQSASRAYEFRVNNTRREDTLARRLVALFVGQ